MKKAMMVLVSTAMLMVAIVANAEVKDIGANPQMKGENISLGDVQDVPSDRKIVSITIFDDESGQSKKIEAPSGMDKIPLQPGQGFNFQWSDAKGTYWQLVTPTSPVGPGLAIVCGDGGCKYVRPVK